jgi:hypothetical protein
MVSVPEEHIKITIKSNWSKCEEISTEVCLKLFAMFVIFSVLDFMMEEKDDKKGSDCFWNLHYDKLCFPLSKFR